jgi:hypothetical protein
MQIPQMQNVVAMRGFIAFGSVAVKTHSQHFASAGWQNQTA